MTQTTYVISVAAELAGMHPQTLRQYDRLGIVIPQRTKGRGRRYSARDVERLRQVQRLSQDDGVNLEGIRRILELEAELEATRDQVAEMRAELEHLKAFAAEVRRRRERVFSANAAGDVSAVRRGYRPATSGQTEPPVASNANALVPLRASRAVGVPGVTGASLVLFNRR